jgi:hypothetical protein
VFFRFKKPSLGQFVDVNFANFIAQETQPKEKEETTYV